MTQTAAAKPVKNVKPFFVTLDEADLVTRLQRTDTNHKEIQPEIAQWIDPAFDPEQEEPLKLPINMRRALAQIAGIAANAKGMDVIFSVKHLIIVCDHLKPRTADLHASLGPKKYRPEYATEEIKLQESKEALEKQYSDFLRCCAAALSEKKRDDDPITVGPVTYTVAEFDELYSDARMLRRHWKDEPINRLGQASLEKLCVTEKDQLQRAQRIADMQTYLQSEEFQAYKARKIRQYQYRARVLLAMARYYNKALNREIAKLRALQIQPAASANKMKQYRGQFGEVYWRNTKDRFLPREMYLNHALLKKYGMNRYIDNTQKPAKKAA